MTLRLPPALRVLRPQQWAKNLLLFLPAVAAHLEPSVPAALRLLLGFIAFSAAASAAYALNDIVDIEADRGHPYKRTRAIAAGEITVRTAYIIALVALVASVLISMILPTRFQATLLVYVVLTFTYTGRLKRVPVLDVVLLGTMYSVRLVAGAALADVPLSRWFLAFSTFFFFSLAIAKRVVELNASGELKPMRRGYITSDAQTLNSLGTAASMVAALVYCLYITAADAQRLYSRPDVLWAGLPILIYWQARLWLLVGRDEMHDDPVVFALQDRLTLGLVPIFAIILWLAS